MVQVAMKDHLCKEIFNSLLGYSELGGAHERKKTTTKKSMRLRERATDIHVYPIISVTICEFNFQRIKFLFNLRVFFLQTKKAANSSFFPSSASTSRT